MNIFFDNLETLIDAPNGIEKARELILQLAVQGKLTEQNPKDEPAPELLKKIKNEKEKLIAEGKIKKQSEYFPIPVNERPFSTPKGWTFCRLNEICNLVYGKNLPTTDLIPEGYDVFGANGIIGKYSRYLYENPQLLISCRGAYSGKPNISPAKSFVTNNSIVCEFYSTSACDINFFHSVIALPQKQNIITGSAQPQVTIANVKNLIIPLPPLNEQKRIVAKVNSLMALLDELEEKRERRNQKRIKLNSASLDKLLTSKDDKEQKENWKRIEENFSTLYSVPENVEKLKQAILQLAVQGKLVKQDPKDEPASELLKKIKKEKDKLIAEGKIRKQNEFLPIKDEEKPFKLPKGWEWCWIDEICSKVTDGVHQTPHYTSKGIPFLSVTELKNGELNFTNTKFISKEDHNIFFKSCNPEKGDVLLCKVGGTIGVTAVVEVDFPFSIFVQLALLKPIKINPYFVKYVLLSSFIQDYIRTNSFGSAMPYISIGKIRKITFPLPSLNEQKRIVEKVNELMSLCNALEEKLTKKEEEGERLVKAVVNEVTNNPKKTKEDKELLIKDLINKHRQALEKLS